MAPQDPQAAALLTHVLSQIEQNVDFLASQNYISQADASAILTKLPNPNNNSMNGLAARFSTMPTPGAGARATPPPPAPASNVPTARALWAYNEGGEDPEDLQFSVGDVIEVVEETNADWWTGRFKGRQGLFPSAYVEKVVQVGKSTKPYKPFGAAYHGVAQPLAPAPVAPPPAPMHSYSAPPPPGAGRNGLGLSEKEGQQEKKDKYGAYKNTMAHSAAAGVGMGAGAAIGGGLVRAIF
ncbi:hypothetical protein CPB83DRAFT_794937 [Crepidotus variabilis]|uniref:SH3 domain-containing protein n=1 Tax=Crepidotus variabilis TaxID=179855 RepID=A0A9P6EBH7_9AGAR|nr:hypothetical protein CPB83DRAFT_794937 [Crepidotus variabilis]